MKRWCSLVLAMLMLFCSMDMTKASASILFNGWELKHPTDEFGDTDYDQWYLERNVTALIMDKYNNVAGYGVVSFAVTETFSAFTLWELDGLSQMFDVTDRYSSYTVSIKDGSGNKHQYTCKRDGGLAFIAEAMSLTDRITMPEKSKENTKIHNSLCDIFAAGGNIEIVIKPANTSGNVYNLTIEDDSSFISAYPIVDVGRFFDEMAIVTKYKEGFCDVNGRIVVPCEWDSVANFSEGMAKVKRNGKSGFIDKSGRLIIPCDWDDASSFSEGLAWVKKNNKQFFIDKMGKIVFECDGAWVLPSPRFTEGLLMVKENGKMGFIDKTGKFAIPCKWEYDSSGWHSAFNNGFLVVGKNGKKGMIDKTGKMVIPYKWDSLNYFYDGLAYAVDTNGKFGYVDKTGALIIPCIWDYACKFSEGLAFVKQNDKYGAIDKSGNLVIPCVWDNAWGFSEGLATVEQDDKYGVIDKSGNLVIPCSWDYVFNFHEGLARVEKNNKNGFIDKDGKVVIPCEWGDLDDFDEQGMTAGLLSGKWYVLDTKGNKTPIQTATTETGAVKETATSAPIPTVTPTPASDITTSLIDLTEYTDTELQELKHQIDIELQKRQTSSTSKPQITPSPTTEPSYTPLKQGNKGDDVMNMKKRLQELGYFSAGAEFSNQYNKTTTDRVKLFQKVNGLKQTGVADEATLKLLFSDKAKRNPN